MKKAITVISMAVFLTGGVFFSLHYFRQDTPKPAGPRVWETAYEVEVESEFNDKIVLSDNIFSVRFGPPSLKGNLDDCDSVIQGQIIKAEGVYVPFLTETPLDEKIAAMSPDGQPPSFAFTQYTIQVEACIWGEKTEDVIYFRVLGGFDATVTKPQGNERVVLFIRDSFDGFYRTVDYEHSIFTIDEEGRLYSFSNTKALSEFDGKPVSALIDEIGRAAKELEENPLP